jgi:hypothetical protein
MASRAHRRPAQPGRLPRRVPSLISCPETDGPMNLDADRPEPMPGAHRAAGRLLAAATVACLVGAGLLLWARSGEAIFSDLVLSALAWCF